MVGANAEETRAMPTLSIRGRLRRIILLAGLGAFPGCGSPREADRPSPQLPVYSPEAARLFDDTFAPLLFGFDAEARDLTRDLKLRERTRLASFVLPARVETVSRVGGLENRGAYEVTLAPGAEPLVGSYPGGPIELTIPASNPSYAWIEGAGAAWVGTRVLAFGRYYAGAPPELHFRCEADSQELRAIVARDAALRALR
jgi:hypothetical protein